MSPHDQFILCIGHSQIGWMTLADISPFALLSSFLLTKATAAAIPANKEVDITDIPFRMSNNWEFPSKSIIKNYQCLTKINVQKMQDHNNLSMEHLKAFYPVFIPSLTEAVT
jgi:hypothetical protein